MKGLTEKQQNILNLITEFENAEGMAPTVYELADHFGIKTSTVFAHLRALQRKGKIIRSSKARSLKVVGATPQSNTCPTVGAMPLENVYGKIGEFHIDRSQSELEQYFAFEVPDDSMADFGIYSEDIVIVNSAQASKPGDLTVIAITHETLLRCFYPLKDNSIELRPANSTYYSQICKQTDIKIRGVVTALQRKY